MTFIPDLAESKKKYYFCNELVEFKMTKYLWSGCTNVIIRNSVMEHANELITQLIRKQRLFVIYNGHDPSSFAELVHVAYMQIERTLYKYRARPHCRACFSYDRPNSSVLYNPSRFEFGIIKPYKLVQLIDSCPYCGADITVGIDNIVEPQQGLYGGTDAICYRGLSKVFNLWCVSPESLIITNNGIEEIGDTIENNGRYVDGSLTTVTGEHNRDVFTRMGLAKSTMYVRRTNVDMLKVTTQYQYNLRSSKDHQYMVLTSDGPQRVKAEDLHDGMLLGIQYNQQQFGNYDAIDFRTTIKVNSKSWVVPEKWNTDLAYIVGLLVSEGYFLNRDKTKVGICNNEIAEFINSLPCGLRLNLKIGKNKKDVVYRSNSKVFAEFVRWLNIDSGASKKSIPKQILKCSKEIIAAFLCGLFDGDGHSKRNDGSVGYSSSSRKLIDQLRVVLLNFGILSTLSITKRQSRLMPGRKTPSKLKTSYQILLSTKDSTEFYDQIGFNIERKQLKQSSLPPTNFRLIDIITTREIQRYLRSVSFSDFVRITGNRNWRQNVCKKQQVTIETFEKLYSALPDMSNNEFLHDRYNEYIGNSYKMIWVPILNINEDGKSDTVDIEVPETGEFVVNGIATRNSQVSRTVILAYVKKDTRDTRNGDNYTIHINKKPDQNNNEQFVRALVEAKNEIWFNDEYCDVINSLIELSSESDADKNLKRKLMELSGKNKKVVEESLSVLKAMMNLYSEQFDNGKLKCS